MSLKNYQVKKILAQSTLTMIIQYLVKQEMRAYSIFAENGM
jgi:hypothetical protein